MRLFDLAVATKLAGSGGGGGSSDLTTATVTIVSQRTEPTEIYTIPCAYDENAMYEGSEAMIMNYLMVDANSTTTVTVPLYKGSCFLELAWDATVSGDITLNGGFGSINGDGTITLLNS